MKTVAALCANIEATIIGDPQTEVTGINYDTRKVQLGDLFACLSGDKVNSHTLIPLALAAGATVLLVEHAESVPDGVSAIVVADTRAALALISAAFYDHPADSLTLVGVTGTNGKTTVTSLLRHILLTTGHPAGLIGTLAYHIGDEVIPAPHTTPQAPELQQLLARMRDAGLTHAVMEVSSHALCLHRILGCSFRYAALTNLTQDHLDFHQTIEAYRDAKAALFTNPSYQPEDKQMIVVLNADDPTCEYFAAQAQGTVVTFGQNKSDYQAVQVQHNTTGNSFLLLHPGGETPVITQLLGTFNVSNSLAALALAGEMGIPVEKAAAALSSAPPIDGRFQRVYHEGGPVVIVDYAHTPDGLDKVLATAHEISQGRVTVVFGCGGNRDCGKRPLMAAVAAKWATRIIVTSDNPRSEIPTSIIDDIMAGFPADKLAQVLVEPDRKTAIQRAINEAAVDDMVVLAGKGHETYQIFAEETIHFDDREVALDALNRRKDGGDAHAKK